jgi:hypothetical protein
VGESSRQDRVEGEDVALDGTGRRSSDPDIRAAIARIQSRDL